MPYRGMQKRKEKRTENQTFVFFLIKFLTGFSRFSREILCFFLPPGSLHRSAKLFCYFFFLLAGVRWYWCVVKKRGVCRCFCLCFVLFVFAFFVFVTVNVLKKGK